jgi:hypothetical protein
MPTILVTLLPTLLGLLQMAPQLVTEIEQVIGWLKGNGAVPTADQQAQIDAALDAAHAALQAS